MEDTGNMASKGHNPHSIENILGKPKMVVRPQSSGMDLLHLQLLHLRHHLLNPTHFSETTNNATADLGQSM